MVTNNQNRCNALASWDLWQPSPAGSLASSLSLNERRRSSVSIHHNTVDLPVCVRVVQARLAPHTGTSLANMFGQFELVVAATLCTASSMLRNEERARETLFVARDAAGAFPPTVRRGGALVGSRGVIGRCAHRPTLT